MSKAAPTMMAISDKEYNLLTNLVYDRFGINLTEQKRSLLVGRLQKILKAAKLTSFEDYYNALLSDRSGEYLDQLINNISTNFSFFYREEAHFNFFRDHAFPELVKRLKELTTKDIRIWTAGCSTGEEPYMLIMLMMEYLGLQYREWAAGILATDISDRVLNLAKKAVYPIDRANKVPLNLKNKYFTAIPPEELQVNTAVRKEITLRRFNLMNSNFPFKKPFQMIFCRNVMIYFDQKTRERLVKKFHQALEPGGYLFIGHSETLGREQQLFKYVMPACYCKL